jgi:hypothetical protein
MSPIPCERPPKRKKTATQLLTTSKLPALPNSGRVHRCRRRQIAFSHTKLTTNLHYQKSPKLRSVTLRKTIQTLNKTNLPRNAITLKSLSNFQEKRIIFPPIATFKK